MWAHTFGLAASNIQREFGFSDKEFGNIAAAFSSGITAGAFVWGVLVDVVGSLPIWISLLCAPMVLRVLIFGLGRRVAFLGTSLIAGVFGMCLGVQSSYNGLVVIIAFIGFGIGGNIPTDSTSEHLDNCSGFSHRSLILAIKLLSSIFHRCLSFL